MSNRATHLIAAASSMALGVGLLASAPAASSQSSDTLTMALQTAGDSTFGANDYYWCQDGTKPSSKVPPAQGECNFPKNAGPTQLLSGQSISATVTTAAQGTTNFSVTGNCSIGTSSYDFTTAPTPTTSVQIAQGGTFYLTVLGQGDRCTLTASTPGSSNLAATTSTFSVTSPINYDSITLNVASFKGQTYNAGASYWCDDTDAANYDPTSSTSVCNFATKDDPLDLPFQQSISATVFTASNTSETVNFSVTGNCAVGSSAFDQTATPATSAQVQAGDDVYLTALSGTGQCVMTGTTPGTASLSPGSYTYTVNLALADQQPNAALPKRKRMRVGQRLRLQGADGIQTNAGQTVSWRVLKRSRDNCRVIERKNGSAVLRATSRGQCRVVARAPGVANEWNGFTQRITIRVR